MQLKRDVLMMESLLNTLNIVKSVTINTMSEILISFRIIVPLGPLKFHKPLPDDLTASVVSFPGKLLPSALYKTPL